MGVSWRLAQGPIDLGWLADRARSALTDDAAGDRVSFDRLALAWEGFEKGVDHPLDLRVSNLVIADAQGRNLLVAPDAHVTLSLAGLLLGRLVPRDIEADGGQVTVTREATGQINLGWGQDITKEPEPGDGESLELGELRQQIAHPASGDHGAHHGVLDQIRRAHFRDTAVMFHDRESGITIKAARLDIDLVRAASGIIRGFAQGRLAMGGEQAAVEADVELASRGESRLRVRLTPFRPAGIAGLPPSLAFLNQVDAPVALTASAIVDAALKPVRLEVGANFGSGLLRIGQGAVPLRGAVIALAGTPDAITINKAHLELARTAEGAAESLDLGGSIARAADRLTATLTLAADKLNVANLPRFWPAGVGGGSRSWITSHITGGTATNGRGSFVLEADAAMRNVVLTKAVADLDTTNTSFTWLDDMPPIEQASVHLHLADPDTLDIHLLSGRQRVANRAADLVIRDATMRITGLSLRDQIAQIHVQAEGPVVSTLALLSEPRLHLLSVHPLGLAPVAGEGSASLDFQFPLENKLQIDDVQIHVTARLTRVRVPAVVAGQDLGDGAFDLSVDKDGLSFRGRGVLARVPVTLDGTLDFNQGLPDQIVQRVSVAGRPDAAQLDAAGLAIGDVVSGPIQVSALLVERRSGDGSVALVGDLTQARMEFATLAWVKPAGLSVNATATLMMSHDRPVKLDRIVVAGDGVTVNGSANFTDGRMRSVQLDQIRLGRTQGHGTIHIGDVIDVVVQGGTLDLVPKLAEKMGAAPEPSTQVTTPAWKLDARFDHALLANGEMANDLLANATGGGAMVGLLDVLGTIPGGGGFSIRIEPQGYNEPQGHKRHLAVEAKDAGRFLRGIDAIRGMESGQLRIDGVFDGPFGLRDVAGTAVIDEVVVHNSPVLGKLLQAITLYGLVDALRGPGMRFARIVAPYRYDGAELMLNDARAANPSLGLTAQGRIGLASGRLSINGTIVPAYFFNSMLGQLPLVGKLFSPEKGGGVFAARFGLEGSIDNPSLSLNPISALTPGFLRDIFSIFDKPAAAPAAPGKVP